MSQYPQPSDLTTYATNAFALQGISNGVQVAACISASSEADGYTCDRYPLPYSPPFPISLVMYTSYIAVYMLFQARGFQPDSGADSRIEQNYWAATWNPNTGILGFFSRVKRQEISIPDLIYTKAAYPNFAMPSVRTGGPSSNSIRGWTRTCR